MTSGLFFSGIAVVIGVLCAVFTDFSIKIVVIALGAMAVVKGIYDFVKFRSVIKDDSVFQKTLLIRSLISIVIGLLAVALPMAFFKTAENIVHILLFVLGAYFVFCAVAGVLMMRRLNNASITSKPYRSSVLVYVLIAVLLFLLASIGVKNILRIAGIVTAVCGVIGCIYSWRNRSENLVPDSVTDVQPEEIKYEIKEDDGENL